jgi:tRNA 2-selenouridine synthase
MKAVSFSDALRLPRPIFVDVRAPVEFNEDHVPGSVNLPVFNDWERVEVGKIYRACGQQQAVVRGSEIVGEKLGPMIREFSRVTVGFTPVVYCFRGGMRSTAFTSLLDSVGFDVYRLAGGYREYRRFVMDYMQNPVMHPHVFVVHGLTGTGKTDILRNIPASIDLESLAGHRGSVFGAIGTSPYSQKFFESGLMRRMEDLAGEPYMVIEGESRKIGDIHLPEKILRCITSCPGILVRASMERRVEILMREYAGAFDVAHVIAIVRSLESRLGKKAASHLVDLISRERRHEFIEFLLEKYYDPLYSHTLGRMNFIATVENDSSERAAAQITHIIGDYISGK